MQPAWVVAGWAGFNGLLLAILAGFGGYPLEWALYTGSVALVGLVALAVWSTRQQQRHTHPVYGGELAALIAIGCTLLGLALIFGWWFVMFAAWPFAAAMVRAASLREK